MDRVRKIILLLVIIASLIILGVSCSTGESEGVLIGSEAPDFQLKNLAGQSVSLSDFRGKPVLINFWATWCPPCRSEMPYLQTVYEEWSGRGLVVLAVNVGESSSVVAKFMESQSLSLPVLLDREQDVGLKYNIKYFPTSLFIDKDGIIQVKIIGAFPNKEAIEKNLIKIVP